MKLYLALNQAGTGGEIGLHTRLAILSARKNSQFEIVLLYTGERNNATKWLEAQEVRLVDTTIPYIDTLVKLTNEGRYSLATLGHWLRTNVCLEEKDDTFVLYTDVDVVFFSQTQAASLKPAYFSAAPEFKKDSWNYCNAGVMVANIKGLRSEYPIFEQYLIENIEKSTYGFNDQSAYNIFYRGRWDRLPVTMNWKPYWGLNNEVEILHFHGPKLGAIASIINGSWDWSTNYGRQLGSLFASSVDAYKYYIGQTLENAPGLPQHDVDYINSIQEAVCSFDVTQVKEKIDLTFTDFKLFPDGE